MALSGSNIQSTKIKGHTGAVLCLDNNNHGGSSSVGGCLLSGSEDGTARLWDLRSSPKASTCIVAGGEVTSVAFGLPSATESSPGDEFSRDFTV